MGLQAGWHASQVDGWTMTIDRKLDRDRKRARLLRNARTARMIQARWRTLRQLANSPIPEG